MLDFFTSKKELTKKDVENEVLACLENGDFDGASKKVIDFEAKQPFSRGMGIDWKKDSKMMHSSYLEMLHLIFSSNPPIILKSLESYLYKKVMLGAALSYLWGTSSNEVLKYFSKEDLNDFKNSNVDFEKSCRLLGFYCCSERDKKDWSKKDSFVKSVEILGGGKSCCDYCKEMNGKIFQINEVPELPFEKCSSLNGCKCTLLPVLD